MGLAAHLHPAAVLIAPTAADKWQLLERLVEAMVACGGIAPDRQAEALAAMVARERCVSTGMEHGVAIPHAALDGLERMTAAMALIPAGLPFDSQDGEPAQIVVAILVPREEKLLHLQTLAEAASRLGDVRFRDDLLGCRDGRAAVARWATC
jgi:mannitol/fructose-specific phosphotransferase system IIA component (Ntr-type)